MNGKALVLAALAATTIAHAGQAEVTTYGSLTFASEYVDRSQTFSDGRPALQFYGEIESNGIYGGLFASNVDFGDDENVEVDLYLGYRGALGDLSYDIGYGRYYFDDSGDCCGEVLLYLSYPLGDSVEVQGALEYDPDAETLASELTLDFGVTEALHISGTYGRNEAGDNNYWNVGANYALADAWSLDLRYYDTTTDDEIIGLAAIYEFSFLGQ